MYSSFSSTGPLRKDGKPDMRYNENRNPKDNSQKILAFGPQVFANVRNILTRYYCLKFNLKTIPNITFTKYRTDLPNDINFSVISINKNQSNDNRQEKIARDLVSCSGFELDGIRAIVMEISNDREKIEDIFNHMYDQNDYILDQLFNSEFSGTLNFSNFNKRFHLKLNFNEKGILEFVLFLCAKHALTIDKDVRIIDFRNNNLHSLIAFLPSRKIFPNLETIIVEGNSTSDNAFIFNEITATGVSIQQSTGGFIKHKIVKLPEPIEPPIELPPPEIATNKNEGKTIEILPSEFIANPFLISFLKQSEEDMSCISNFYGESAVMSVTAETSTDLTPYKPFTRSLKNGRDNYVQGPEEINEFCLAIFGNSIIFKITKIQANELFENGYIMVLHGYFVDERQVTIGFDRTLLIGHNGVTFFITNDQIHLRSFDE